MKIKLLAEDRTNEETIDYLADGIEQTMPIPIDVLISDERYVLDRDNLYSGGGLFGQTQEKLDEISGIEIPSMSSEAPELIFFNLKPVADKFSQKDQHLMILTHSPFVYLKKEIVDSNSGIFFLESMGRAGYYLNKLLYGGITYKEDRLIIVGGDNFSTPPKDNNTKIACHEIAHLFLKKGSVIIGRAGLVSPDHQCDEYIDGKRCLMNVDDFGYRGSPEELEEVYLGFCEPCEDIIKRNYYQDLKVG